MGTVVVVGSVNVDLVATVERLPRAGETVLARGMATHQGGKGANQACAAAARGATTRLVAAVGDDAGGAAALADLRSRGVATDLVRVVGAPTGTALITVDASGANHIVVAAGANALVELDAAALVGADVLVVQMEVPLPVVRAALVAARSSGVLTILNPSPVPPEGLESDVLEHVDVLCPNDGEAKVLSGCDAVPDAIAALRRRGCGAVVVTTGERGATWSADGTCHDVAAPSVEVVDTTGAGDAFVGTLAALLAEGRPLAVAVEAAVEAASASVRVAGARPS